MSTKALAIAPDLPLPLDFMLRTTVVYGGKDAGKTTLGSVVAEEVHRAGQRFCAIDLKGDFWGLKSSADGKSPGIPVVVFGGDHQDLPLDPAAGRIMGARVARMKHSVVLDLEHLHKAQQVRFLGEFFDSLYFHNREPLLVIADEIQVYAPQKTFTPEAHACLGAVEHLVKLGRKHGLGFLAITQRGANLNKDVSELCETLIALRTAGELDHDRIEGWLRNNFKKAAFREVIDGMLEELSSFENGQAIFASAHPKLNFLKVARTRLRQTFDSSATPEIGKRRRAAPRALAKPEIDQLRDEMAAEIQKHKENDPVELKKRIKELEAARDKVMKDVATRLDEAERVKKELAELKAKHSPVAERHLKRLEKILDKLTAAAAQLDTIQGRMAQAQRHVAGEVAGIRSLVETIAGQLLTKKAPPIAVVPPKAPAAPPAETKEPSADTDGVLSRGEALVLSAYIQYPEGLTTEQIAVLTGYKESSRLTYNKKLVARGYLESRPEKRLAVTVAGRAAMPNVEPLPTGEALRQHVMATLPQGEQKVLAVLVEAYPQSLRNAEIEEKTNYKESSRITYLKKLRARELVTTGDGLARASDNLFN